MGGVGVTGIKGMSCGHLTDVDPPVRIFVPEHRLGVRVDQPVKERQNEEKEVGVREKKLLGKKIIIVNNLKSRKMKFGESEGMLLAADNDEKVYLIEIDKDVINGAKIR